LGNTVAGRVPGSEFRITTSGCGIRGNKLKTITGVMYLKEGIIYSTNQIDPNTKADEQPKAVSDLEQIK